MIVQERGGLTINGKEACQQQTRNSDGRNSNGHWMQKGLKLIFRTFNFHMISRHSGINSPWLPLSTPKSTFGLHRTLLARLNISSSLYSRQINIVG